jgi:hypothetical protein
MALPVSALEWILEAVEPGFFCTSSLSPDAYTATPISRGISQFRRLHVLDPT